MHSVDRIIGIERAKEILGEFALHYFPSVLELHWYLQEEAGVSCVDMTLSSAAEAEQERGWVRGRVRLRFEGVLDLRIEDWGPRGVVNGLEIADLSNRQLEGVKWEVFDFEEGRIRFFCNRAELLSAERL